MVIYDLRLDEGWCEAGASKSAGDALYESTDAEAGIGARNRIANGLPCVIRQIDAGEPHER